MQKEPGIRMLDRKVHAGVLSLQNKAEKAGPKVNERIMPVILAAKRELDSEVQRGNPVSNPARRNAKAEYLQNPQVFEERLNGIASEEIGKMEKGFYSEIKSIGRGLFWSKVRRAAVCSLLIFTSAFSSATFFYAAYMDKSANPLQQKVTLGIGGVMAVVTAMYFGIGTYLVKGAYRNALREIGETKRWMEKTISEVAEFIGEKIEGQKKWWLGSFRQQQ